MWRNVIVNQENKARISIIIMKALDDVTIIAGKKSLADLECPFHVQQRALRRGRPWDESYEQIDYWWKMETAVEGGGEDEAAADSDPAIEGLAED